MNLAFGLGSFMQKDTKGGLTLAGGYAAFAGLLAWELSLSYDDGLAGVPGAFGLTALAATVAYSFIRPNIYNKKRVSAGFMDGVDIALVPGYRGGDAVRVSYTVHF
ncbi:MAG: hypothetical protein LBQ88_05890 [Treponema sp.]|nr:hypothetical protein [Treponema sp.]